MKILHIAPYFAPAWAYGGTPRAIYEIARRQVRLGHEITILTTDAYTKNRRLKNGFDSYEKMTVLRLKNLSNSLVWNYHFPLPVEWKSLKSDFDIVHVHETRTLLHTLYVLFSKPTRLFYSPWGTLPFNDRLSFVKKVFDYFLINSVKEKIKVAFVQNDHEKQMVKKWKESAEVHILPLGIDYSFFNGLPNKQTCRDFFNLKKDNYVFLFLGRFSEVKGLKLLIESFGSLTNNNAKLLIVGRDDGYLQNMKKLITSLHLEGKVIVSDPLYEKDRLTAYSAADCFIFTPTVYEETSTACLEALACGIPVIATHQAAIPFLTIKDGVYEIPDKEAEVVKAMNYMLKFKPTVNHTKVKHFFDWDNIVLELQKYYEK